MLNSNNMRVKDVMLKSGEFPIITRKVMLKEALEMMGDYKLGIVCIVDDNSKLLGIITDGDIRRKLLKVQKPFSAFFVDDAIVHAIKNPVTVLPDTSLIEAVELMGKKQVWDLPVTGNDGELQGLLHLHPAIRTVLGLNKK